MIKVLIVDDEEDLTFFVKANLEMNGGYEVFIVNKARDVLRSALKFRPDVILLDIRMPQISGYEILKKLKEEDGTLAIPVIMLTAVDSEESKIRAAGLYGDDYIVKPVRLEILKSKIENVLRRRKFPS